MVMPWNCTFDRGFPFTSSYTFLDCSLHRIHNHTNLHQKTRKLQFFAENPRNPFPKRMIQRKHNKTRSLRFMHRNLPNDHSEIERERTVFCAIQAVIQSMNICVLVITFVCRVINNKSKVDNKMNSTLIIPTN